MPKQSEIIKIERLSLQNIQPHIPATFSVSEVNISIHFNVCRTDQKPITQEQYENIKFFIETLIEESEGEFSILPLTDQEAKIDCFYKSFIY